MKTLLFKARIIDDEGRLEITSILTCLFAISALLEPTLYGFLGFLSVLCIRALEHVFPAKIGARPIVDELSAYKKKVDDLATNLRAVNLRVGLGTR